MSGDPTMDPDGPASDGILAAEYVLGVLDAAERRAVERRLAREPALAAEVAAWEERLTALTDAVAPAPAPPDGWSRIEAAITAETAGALARPSVWQSLAFWRGLTVASATLAAASIAALVYVSFVPAARPALTATLGGSAGQPNFVAAVTAQGNSLVIVPAALLTSDPHAYELWLIPRGDTAPRSLGLIQPGQPVTLGVPGDLAGRLTPDATLAVSIEPPGGSPNGRPTTVIASGRLTKL
jgi:anti-sigma-K factor RskA